MEEPRTQWEYPKSQRWRLGLLRASLNSDRQLYSDDLMVILEDTGPKSRYHYLALPRETIDTVTDLTPDHIPLLEHMIRQSEAFAEREIRQKTKFPVILGFHVIPTFIRLHMHIITTDFQGPANSGSEDYKSFTNKILWLEVHRAIEVLREKGKIVVDKNLAEELKHCTDEPMQCYFCSEIFYSVGKLKSHILSHGLE